MVSGCRIGEKGPAEAGPGASFTTKERSVLVPGAALRVDDPAGGVADDDGFGAVLLDECAVGLGLAIGFGLSFLLWLLFGSWGPPLLVPLSSLGGLAGLVTGVYSYGRTAAQLHNAADDASHRS